MTEGLVTNGYQPLKMATTVHEREKGVAISLSLSIVFPIKPICKCSDTSKKSLATPVSDEVATK